MGLSPGFHHDVKEKQYWKRHLITFSQGNAKELSGEVDVNQWLAANLAKNYVPLLSMSRYQMVNIASGWESLFKYNQILVKFPLRLQVHQIS